MSSDGNSILYPTIGFGAGLALFIKGFREFRRYRLMADTPAIPIRSMAMGLVEIYGTARGEQLVSAPVSHTPCFWYRVEIEERAHNSEGREEWADFATDVNGVNFYLEDATGRVLVNPRQAELDLKPRFQVERYAETYVEGGDPYINTVAAGTAVPHFIASKPPAAAAPAAADPDPSRTLSMDEARQKPDFPRREMPLERRAQQSTGTKAPSFFRRVFAGGPCGRFLLTEYCILPGQPYHICGTCAENPHPRDEHDRNMILKGKDEPNFLISYRSEKDVERGSRDQALKMIFGGAAVSLFCLAIILGKLGLF